MRITLKRKLLFAFLGLAAGPLLVGGMLFGWYSYRVQRQYVFEHETQIAVTVATHMRFFFNRIALELEQLGRFRDLATLDSTSQADILGELLARQKAFRTLVLLAADGEPLAAASTLNRGQDWEQTVATESVLAEARRQGRLAYGAVRFDTQGDEPLMEMALPLADPAADRPAATIIATVELKQLWNEIAVLPHGDTKRIFILDSDHRVVAFHNPSVVLSQTRFTPPSAEVAIGRGLAGELSVIACQTVELGGQRLTAVKEMPASRAFAPTITTVQVAFLLLAAVLIVALLLVLLAGRTIVRPVENLTAAARNVMNGDLDARAAAETDDEIGELAEAFNSMTARLKQSLDSLSREIEQRETEQRILAESERYNRTLFEESPVGLALCRMDGSLIDVNPAFARIIGRTVEETVTLSYWEITPADYAAQEEEQLALLETTGRYGPYEKEYLHRDDHRVPVLLQGLLLERHGERFIWSSVEDITERRRAETALSESERLFRGLFENATDGIVMADIETRRFVSANRTFHAMLGCEGTDIATRGVEDIHFPEDLAMAHTQFSRLASGEIRVAHDIPVRRCNGERFFADISAFPIIVGDATYLVGIFRDISERKETEERLRLSEKAIANALEGILITDADQTIVFVNRAFCEITGYGCEEVLGQRPSMMRSGRHGPGFYAGMWDSLAKVGFWQGEIWDRRKNGEVYPKWLSINAVRGTDNEITHYVGVFSDITLQKKNEEELRRLAHYDPLTGLANRTLFLTLVGKAITSAARHRHRLAVIFLDLDRFKYVNDTLGHQAGDRLLAQIAERLRRCVRDEDVVCRLGGDEFTLLLANYEGDFTPDAVCQRIIQVVAEPVELDGHTVIVSASLGIALYPRDGEDVATLTKHADIAMYQAKEKGKNRYQFFDESLNLEAVERMILEIRLRQALIDQQLALAFQPRQDLTTGQPAGCEALLRWHDPERGELLPETFLPIAEETGLIGPIGQLVLRLACRQARKWRETAPELLPVSVNLSARQFADEQLPDLLAEALAETGLEPAHLEIELTESTVMNHAAPSRLGTLTAIREQGIGISIDDFGTGYSSLATLKRMPCNTIKIDRRFIAGIPDDVDDAAIVAAAVAMARNLGIRTVAEGVETAEQLAFLTEHGVELIQGYLFCRPLPAAELTAHLGDRAGSGPEP